MSGLHRLPSELAQRISVLESEPVEPDLDRASWIWLVLLGVALPIALLIVGWAT